MFTNSFSMFLPILILLSLFQHSATQGCEPEQVQCSFEEHCLDPSMVCDGVPDCSVFGPSSSDETGCSHGACSGSAIKPLIGGTSLKEGLVEVCVQGGFYQVYLPSLSIAEASVMCRQLNQGTAGFPISVTHDLGLVGGILPPKLANVSCYGTEQSLSECTLTFISTNIISENVAAIKCIEATVCAEGSTRLVPASPPTDGSLPSEGRLEICFLKVWGGVYDPNWSFLDAAVTCQSFGFNPKGAVPLPSVVHASDPQQLPIVYDIPECPVLVEGSILNCPRSLIFGVPIIPNEPDVNRKKRSISQAMSRLNHLGQKGERSNRFRRQSEPSSFPTDVPPGVAVLGRLLEDTLGIRALKHVVGVRCEAFQNTGCETFDIRLALRGRGQSTGQMEICIGNVWQSVCSGSMTLSDADVVCRVLGFTDYEGTNAQHGIFNSPLLVPGPTFFLNVSCEGSETNLSFCGVPRRKRIVNNCEAVVYLRCLARPLIILDPPLNSGILTLEENRRSFFNCTLDGLNFPAVNFLTFGRSIDNGELFPIDTPLTLAFSPTLNDSGTYNCTAFTNELATNSTFQIVVKGADTGEAVTVNYLRFSTSSSLSSSSESIGAFYTDLEMAVLDSININIPGQQAVSCYNVSRTEVDVTRRLDRYECVITTSGGSVDSSNGVLVAQSAANVMQAIFPGFFAFLLASSSGFCNAEQTESFNVRYFWPDVATGTIATLPCDSSSDFATRECGQDRVWLQPNILSCAKAAIIIRQLLTENVTLDKLEKQLIIVGTVLLITEDDKDQQTPILLVLVSTYFTSVSALLVSNETNIISLLVVKELVGIVGSLLQWSPNLFVETDDSSSITMSFESIIEQYAQNLPVNKSITILTDAFILIAENLPLKTLQRTGRSIPFKDNAISLPPSLFANITDRDQVGLFFAQYSISTLFPVRDRVNASDAVAGTTTVVGSSVIAATVGPGLFFNNLQPPVEINLRIIIGEGSVFREGSEVCVSWDFDAAGNLGDWTTDGCIKLVTTSKGIVTCQCEHLTNFAVLVDICSRVKPEGCMNSAEFDTALSVITYIGIALSFTGLIITVITMLAFKELRHRDATRYHIQLCIAMIFMQIVFVAGIDQTAVVGGCVVASVLIHYFTLASVMWMLAEALLMFQKLVFVFQKVTKKGIIITSVTCWLAPIIPVAIPLIIDLANGREASNDLIINRDQLCFLSNPIVFWLAFLGPILAIILFNTVIFTIVIVILVKHMRGMMTRKKESMNMKTVFRLMTSVAGIMFLFGLSWLFAAFTFTVEEIRKPAQVLFAIFNSFQGFSVFVFFCLLSKEARESWKQVLSCGRYKSSHLNPTLKSSKKTAGVHKNLNSHGSSSDYTSRNSVSTGVFSSNGKCSSDIGLKYTSSGKTDSHVESQPEKSTTMSLKSDEEEDDARGITNEHRDSDEISVEMDEITITFTDDDLTDDDGDDDTDK